MKENLIKLKEAYLRYNLDFICNCIFYLNLTTAESDSLKSYLEKHKPKKIPKNNGGGWFELWDRDVRIKFLDKLIEKCKE
jgi:hypothetical protein